MAAQKMETRVLSLGEKRESARMAMLAAWGVDGTDELDTTGDSDETDERNYQKIKVGPKSPESIFSGGGHVAPEH